MKGKLILLILLFLSGSCIAQNVTGIWRGYFYSGYGFYKQTYKYEVQINQLSNKSLDGVTYSYKTTVFYGKATLTGIYFPATKHVVIRELKLVELKISDQSEPCLMTCELDYSKAGSTEILQGTFSSIKSKDKSDCGSGDVYLERVTESDFTKEDFLKKIPPPKTVVPQKNTEPVPATVSKDKLKELQASLGLPQDGVIGPKSMAAIKARVPGFSGNPAEMDSSAIDKLIQDIKKSNAAAVKKVIVTPPPVVKKVPETPVKDTTVKIIAPQVVPQQQKEIVKKIIPSAPDVIKKRDNNVVKTIVTNSTDIKILLYDNGEIDGDTVTVYHNNELMAFKKGLSGTPITLSVKADAVNNRHEFVMVADNLGSIPPNTALMVIYTGGKRYELFLSTDNSKNAEVIIEYQPN